MLDLLPQLGDTEQLSQITWDLAVLPKLIRMQKVNKLPASFKLSKEQSRDLFGSRSPLCKKQDAQHVH